MASRPLFTIIAELTAVLQSAAVSSQLDPAAVTRFAGLVAEALFEVDSVQRAADADTVAATVADAVKLADEVAIMRASVAGAQTMLQALQREAADASAQLEAIRAELATIRGELPAGG